MRKLFIISFLFTVSDAFGQSEDIFTKLNAHPKKIVDFPIEYSDQFPTLNFYQWNNDFISFNKFLTPAINKTQQGAEFVKDSIYYWICWPSVRPHVQLDTSTMISDKTKIIGNWRAVQNRNINFTDSATFLDTTIRRKYSILNEYNTMMM